MIKRNFWKDYHNWRDLSRTRGVIIAWGSGLLLFTVTEQPWKYAWRKAEILTLVRPSKTAPCEWLSVLATTDSNPILLNFFSKQAQILIQSLSIQQLSQPRICLI